MHALSKSLRSCSAVLLATAAVLAAAICARAADEPAPSDKPARNAWVLREVVKRMMGGQQVDPALFKEFEDAQNYRLKTGPEVGQRAADFRLSDQDGKSWTLKQLMGPKGLLLAFNRSADW
ncbi:MAG: hypothetical protein ACREQB_01495 [Candidatus Binataceae bacterium]